MNNTKDVLPKEAGGCFLFDYISGILDGESTAQRAELEFPPDRLFGVILTMPVEDTSPRSASRICSSFRAEGVNTPLLFCRCMGKYVLTAMDGSSEEQIRALIKRVETVVGLRMFSVYETGLKGCDLYCAYERMESQLERVFYDGSGFVRAEYERNREIGSFNVVIDAVVKGDVKNAEAYIGSLFRLIECAQPPVSCVKEYFISLYAELLIQNMQHNNVEMIKAVARIESARYLSDVKEVIVSAVKRLAAMNIPENGESYSALVRETVHIINENIGNEDLSLRWIAGNILYTNVDYLGKVFKKETGKNFSHYVMEKRMEGAKSLILEGGNYKIYEVAERVGFGSNSQYFSQVFKKYTGVSPLEYKEYSKELRQKRESGE